MRKRRDSTRVIYEILSLTRKKASLTQIVYKCNLSTRLAKEYLSALQATDLVLVSNNQNGSKVYESTDRGMRLRNSLSQAEEELSRIFATTPLAGG